MERASSPRIAASTGDSALARGAADPRVFGRSRTVAAASAREDRIRRRMGRGFDGSWAMIADHRIDRRSCGKRAVCPIVRRSAVQLECEGHRNELWNGASAEPRRLEARILHGAGCRREESTVMATQFAGEAWPVCWPQVTDGFHNCTPRGVDDELQNKLPLRAAFARRQRIRYPRNMASDSRLEPRDRKRESRNRDARQ